MNLRRRPSRRTARPGTTKLGPGGIICLAGFLKIVSAFAFRTHSLSHVPKFSAQKSGSLLLSESEDRGDRRPRLLGATFKRINRRRNLHLFSLTRSSELGNGRGRCLNGLSVAPKHFLRPKSRESLQLAKCVARFHLRIKPTIKLFIRSLCWKFNYLPMLQW